jgi:hypothetical protein
MTSKNDNVNFIEAIKVKKKYIYLYYIFVKKN